MFFNPVDFDVLPALGIWGLIFGAIVGIALLLSLLGSLFVHGRSGPRFVLRYVFNGSVTKAFQL